MDRSEARGTAESDTTHLTISTDQSQAFTICFRNPYWVDGHCEVLVNGIEQSATIGDRGYILIDRKWNDGDKVDVRLPVATNAKTVVQKTGGHVHPF